MASVAQRDPQRTGSTLGRNTSRATVLVLLGLAAVAWYLTIRNSQDMAGMVAGLGQVGTSMPSTIGPSLFMAMWLTMMIAMMFPTIAPLVLAHRLVVRQRGEGALATVVFVGGYITVWALIGLVPMAALLGFRELSMEAPGSPWLRVTAGIVLVVAGGYQFTPWKRTCLRACRTPLGFLMTHDFGAGATGAFRAGLVHGAYCLGCCWALMSVLVVTGLMNLVWMAILSLVFLAEKNWRHGITVNRIVGPAMILLGIAVISNPEVLAWI